MNDDNQPLLINDYSSENVSLSSKLEIESFRRNTYRAFIGLFIFQIIIFSILISVSVYGKLSVDDITDEMKYIDLSEINKTVTYLDYILSNNGTTKIMTILDSIDVRTYYLYIEKMKYIIDQTCKLPFFIC